MSRTPQSEGRSESGGDTHMSTKNAHLPASVILVVRLAIGGTLYARYRRIGLMAY